MLVVRDIANKAAALAAASLGSGLLTGSGQSQLLWTTAAVVINRIRGGFFSGNCRCERKTERALLSRGYAASAWRIAVFICEIRAIRSRQRSVADQQCR